jgi:hypothetical protein
MVLLCEKPKKWMAMAMATKQSLREGKDNFSTAGPFVFPPSMQLCRRSWMKVTNYRPCMSRQIRDPVLAPIAYV